MKFFKKTSFSFPKIKFFQKSANKTEEPPNIKEEDILQKLQTELIKRLTPSLNYRELPSSLVQDAPLYNRGYRFSTKVPGIGNVCSGRDRTIIENTEYEFSVINHIKEILTIKTRKEQEEKEFQRKRLEEANKLKQIQSAKQILTSMGVDN